MRVDQHKRYSHIGVIDEIGDLVEERKFYFQDKDKGRIPKSRDEEMNGLNTIKRI